MKSYDDWVNETVQEFAPLLAPELPDNVVEVIDGNTFKLLAECCCCEEWFELDIDPSEVMTASDEHGRFYCGKEPRCCP